MTEKEKWVFENALRERIKNKFIEAGIKRAIQKKAKDFHKSIILGMKISKPKT